MTKPLDWRPARLPHRQELRGRYVRLVPLDAKAHAAALYAATHGPGHDKRLWDFMFMGPFARESEFAAWLQACARSPEPLFFAIVDKKLGPAGLASFMRINPGHGVIEIGNIFFAASLQRTRGATEAIYLLLRHAFDKLGYRRVEWKCDARNLRSRRAAERFGFRPEGIFRQHMVIKGQSRDTAWFALIDRDWPKVQAAYKAWLAPTNFGSDGRERKKLKAPSRGYSPRGRARRY